MIIFDNVGKGYRAKTGEINWILRNFTGVLPDGASVGILARKGAGKTTLVNLLAGVDIPSEGAITRIGDVSWPFGYRGNLSPKLSVKQNIRFISDMYGRDFKKTVAFIEEFSELGKNLEEPLGELTIEMRSRLAASAFFAMDFRHLLFDESIGAGNLSFKRKCARYVEEQSGKTAMLIASGNPELLKRLCVFGGVLQDGRLTLFSDMETAADVFRRNTMY